MDLGLVHVYTGKGKGKTTAALGLALRALGHGMKVGMIQFMKSYPYGELALARAGHLPNFEILQYGRPGLVHEVTPQDRKLAREAFQGAREWMGSGKYDLLILDELNVALHYGLLDLEQVLELVKQKPPGLELVITGRYAPQQLIQLSDYATEMLELKHPYSRGISARKGIEY